MKATVINTNGYTEVVVGKEIHRITFETRAIRAEIEKMEPPFDLPKKFKAVKTPAVAGGHVFKICLKKNSGAKKPNPAAILEQMEMEVNSYPVSMDRDSTSWHSEEGILISCDDAEALVDHVKSISQTICNLLDGRIQTRLNIMNDMRLKKSTRMEHAAVVEAMEDFKTTVQACFGTVIETNNFPPL